MGVLAIIRVSHRRKQARRRENGEPPLPSVSPPTVPGFDPVMAEENQDTWALNVMIHMDPATMMIVKMNARVRLNP